MSGLLAVEVNTLAVWATFIGAASGAVLGGLGFLRQLHSERQDRQATKVAGEAKSKSDTIASALEAMEKAMHRLEQENMRLLQADSRREERLRQCEETIEGQSREISRLRRSEAQLKEQVFELKERLGER